MTARLTLICLVCLLAGCGFNLPNGVFSCVGPSDCPSGYFCWSSDSRCYDAQEPDIICERDTCEDVVESFGSLGVTIECGTFPDGCDGVVDCPPCGAGETCGANDQNFVCGCEPATCTSVGAECGQVPLGCDLDGTADCGTCPGELVCGDDFRCACPDGQDCDRGCGGGCKVGEVCVEGQCCVPAFPCADNECSPAGGLSDGCGGFVDCGSCIGASCVLHPDSLRFACVDDCSCEARGFECGTWDICGANQLCGVCDSSAPLCRDGSCVCSDGFEPNDTPSAASEVPCAGSCNVNDALFEGQGTLDRAGDVDFYTIEVTHSRDRAFRLDVSGLQSTRELLLTYVCPNGSTEAIVDCSGSSSSLGNDKYCIEDGSNSLRLVQGCSGTGQPAQVIVGIGSKDGEFKGPCDDYSFTVSSFYFEYDD